MCCSKSVRLNTALAVSGLTPLLVGRLDHKDAIARLLLLKMIKVSKIFNEGFGFCSDEAVSMMCLSCDLDCLNCGYLLLLRCPDSPK